MIPKQISLETIVCSKPLLRWALTDNFAVNLTFLVVPSICLGLDKGLGKEALETVRLKMEYGSRGNQEVFVETLGKKNNNQRK